MALSSTAVANMYGLYQGRQELQNELQDELHVQIPPGTEVMRDTRSHNFVKGAKDSVVLVPQPSNEPCDPLSLLLLLKARQNWKSQWKASAIFCATLASFAQTLSPLAIGPIFPQLIQEFDSNLAAIVQFTGITVIVLGFSNFLWIPLSSILGRRFVLLASTLVTLLSCVWRAIATSYMSFYGAAILGGIGGGVGEALQLVIVTDVIFLHERGFYNTIYFAVFATSLMIGPVIAGAMGENVGWRSFWWFNVTLNGIVFLAILVGFPETRWDNERRSTMGLQDQNFTSELDPKLEESLDTDRPPSSAAFAPPVGEGSPSKSQWKLMQPKRDSLKKLVLEFLLPFRLMLYPIVQFAAFVLSWSASCYLMINLVQSEAFSAPPYGFSAQSVGFMNFAPLVGALIGLLTAGPTSDWISARLTQKNDGIREPEMRLVAMAPYVLVMVLGNFIVGFGLQYGWDWRAIVIIGFTCAGLQLTSLPSIAITYAIDSYKPASGAILIYGTIVKNIWGYGVSRFITTWTMQSGYVPPFMVNMCLTTLWCSFAVILWVWGKSLRIRTAKSGVHKL